MKNIKKVLALLLAVIMTVGTVATVGAATLTFTDTEGHWAWTEGYIPYLVEKEVLNGYKKSENSYYFKPDGEVTRAEFIKMLDEAFGLKETKAVSYSDVKSSDWFCVYFQKAAAQGYILNYGTSADPNGKITREEALSLLVRYLRLDETKKASASTFADFDTIDAKYQDYVLEAIEAKLTDGYKQSNGSYLFKPKNTLTRAEALTILYRAAGCIYNKDSYVRDAGAAETNNVITKGGISISDQTLSGRTIISEGASENIVSFSNCNITGTLYIRGNSKVYLDKCKVENVVVTGKGGVSLMNTTTVDNLSISYKTQINVMSGNKIKTLTVDATSTDATVIGEGTIDKIVVKGHDFASTIVPADYEIGKGITAVFGGKEYSDSKDADGMFVVKPYSVENDGYYCIECTPANDGTLYYYYTNVNTAPSTAEFDSLYSKAKNNGFFSVKANKDYSRQTFKTDDVKSYSYIAIMFQVGNEKSDPILIANNAKLDTGFITAPALTSTGLSVTFKTAYNGTVSYFYTDKADKMSQSQFVKKYNECEASLKGTLDTKTNTASQITLNSNLIDDYNYIAIRFKSANGNTYAPVIVAISDDGFSVFPYVKTSGTLSFTTDVTGVLYFYYSKTDAVPTVDDFKTQYTAATYFGTPVSVTANKAATVSYKPSYASTYPYLIMSLRDENGQWYLPISVDLGYESGFAVLPRMTSDNKVAFTTEVAGKVEYYYTSSSVAPTIEMFKAIYASIEDTKKGSVSAYASNYELFITVPEDIKDTDYIVIMLSEVVNSKTNGNVYAPIVLSLKYNPGDNLTGFETNPYIKDGTLYLKTAGDTIVRYYYSEYLSPVSSVDFYDKYRNANATYKGQITAEAHTTKTVTITDDAYAHIHYQGIVIATYNGESYSEPVVLEAFRNSYNPSDTDTLLWSTNDSFPNLISITPKYTGTLYYFVTDSETEARATFNKSSASSKTVTASNVTYVESEGKKYVVIMLHANESDYDKVIINMETGKVAEETGYNGGANSTDTFISSKAADAANMKYRVIPKGECDVYFTLVGDDQVIPYVGSTRRGNVYSAVATIPGGSSQVGIVECDYSDVYTYVQGILGAYDHIYLYVQCVNALGAMTWYKPVVAVTFK